MEEPEALEAWDLESLAMMRRMTIVTMVTLMMTMQLPWDLESSQ